MLKLLVFDLDGTLADTRLDLCNSVNHALESVGRKPLPLETVVGGVGDGARNLMARSLRASGGEPSAAEIETALKAFLAHYQSHALIESGLYPGVASALERLHAFDKAVLTNKPGQPARAILEGLGTARHFRAILGGDNPYGQKPDPAALRHLMKTFGASPSETVMIGDGVQDLAAARNAGTHFVGLLNGMASRAALAAEKPEAAIENMADLPDAIAAMTMSAAAAEARA